MEIPYSELNDDGLFGTLATYRSNLGQWVRQMAASGSQSGRVDLENQIRDAKLQIDAISAELKSRGYASADHLELSDNENEKTQEGVIIPYIVASFIREECAVFCETLQNISQNVNFLNFWSSLIEHNVNASDIKDHYGISRDDWIPYIDINPVNQKTIREIVHEMIHEICFTTKPNIMIQPLSYSEQFFRSIKSGIEISRMIKNHGGGFVFVDTLSFFDQNISNILVKSEILSDSRISVFIIPPLSHYIVKTNTWIEQEFTNQTPFSYERRSLYKDGMYEFGVSDLETLKRRLYAILPAALESIEGQKINPDNRDIFAKYGESRGLKGLFAGKRRKI
jgi:hypothetical protein